MNTITDIDFKKLDLHIHTPASSCYSDAAITIAQIVEAALVFGLDAIGITDHNSVESVDAVRAIAAKDGLVVLPGIELSTRSGHFLVLFEVDTSVSSLRDLLVKLGIGKEQWGDAQAMANQETEEVFRLVTEEGGLVIAAHIERWPSGFLETKELRSAKMAVHASPYLGALEVTIAQDRELWEEGMVRGYPKKYPCIQGSDAHSPVEVGRRPFYARMETISLAGLRTALADFRTSVAFPDEMMD